MAKRKNSPNQPELPIEEAPMGGKPKPSESKDKGASSEAKSAGEGETAKNKSVRNGNGNGAPHILAENVAAAPAHPFKPGKIELPLHRRVDRGFLDYASYVIRDRAIPNLADGLKPVQRRILWALHTMDDGRFMKVANVTGQTMKYHPHGNASIDDALVVLKIGR